MHLCIIRMWRYGDSKQTSFHFLFLLLLYKLTCIILVYIINDIFIRKRIIIIIIIREKLLATCIHKTLYVLV